jgi:hypothetical protein
LDCPEQEKEVIQFYTSVIANRTSRGQAVSEKDTPDSEPAKKKRKTPANQLSLSNFIESTTLTPQRESAINESLFKAFIVCNIPFHVIANPYFIDALRQLRPAYHPPSRQLFSGRLLNSEIIKINQRLCALLEKTTNLTLGNIFLSDFKFNIFN